MTDTTTSTPARAGRPVHGPLSTEAFFASDPPAPGVRPCKRLALGTASLGKLYGTSDQDRGVETLHAAWREGFFLIDTAPGYGPAELLLSEALRRWHGQRPIVATKTKQKDVHLASVKAVYQTSLERLGEIDMLAVHDAAVGFPAEGRRAVCDFVGELLSAGRIHCAGLGGGEAIVQAQWLEADIFRYVITFNRLGAVSLQALDDAVPQANRRGASVFAASPLFMGLLGAHRREFAESLPRYFPPIYLRRTDVVERLAAQWSISLSHLGIRFLLSMPAVDAVLAGCACPEEWADVRSGYEAGPLPAELYAAIWQAAQEGPEPVVGG
jgi:aryl-alcohol dehydrogenase-like predicted oxidoreductase